MTWQINQEMENNGKHKNDNRQWSVFSLAIELGYTIAIPIVLLALIGRVVDKNMETSPLFLLLGIFVSILLTTWLIYRKVLKIIKS